MIKNRPPPSLAARYGKRQMFPNPTAEPAAAATIPNFEPNVDLFSFIAVVYLSDKYPFVVGGELRIVKVVFVIEGFHFFAHFQLVFDDEPRQQSTRFFAVNHDLFELVAFLLKKVYFDNPCAFGQQLFVDYF